MEDYVNKRNIYLKLINYYPKIVDFEIYDKKMKMICNYKIFSETQ